MDQDIDDRLHNAVTSVDRIVQSQIAALQVLAASPLLDDPGRRGDFYREARGFHDRFGYHVLLADPSNQILHTPGSPTENPRCPSCLPP
jgi:hypothetical protein